MNLDELDQRYPNGLDDARIGRIVVDYQNRTAAIHLDLRGNLPDSPERDVYSQAVLQLAGLYYFSMEPPDSEHLLAGRATKLTVDGLAEDPNEFPPFATLRPTMKARAFCCRFYVHEWNSFIHIAAEDAELRWTAADSTT